MSLKSGWCLNSQDCDTDDERGGCPIQTGSCPACDCPCHGGATPSRPYLAPSRAPAAEPAPEPAGQPDEPAYA